MATDCPRARRDGVVSNLALEAMRKGGLVMHDQLKKCSKCAKLLSLANFNPNDANKDGLYTACRACMSAYQAERRAKRKAKNG